MRYSIEINLIYLQQFVQCFWQWQCLTVILNYRYYMFVLCFYLQVDFSSIIDYAKQIIKDNNFEGGKHFCQTLFQYNTMYVCAFLHFQHFFHTVRLLIFLIICCKSFANFFYIFLASYVYQMSCFLCISESFEMFSLSSKLFCLCLQPITRQSKETKSDKTLCQMLCE